MGRPTGWAASQTGRPVERSPGRPPAGRRVRISRPDLDRIIEHGSTRAAPAAATSRPAPGPAPNIWEGEVPLPAAPAEISPLMT